MTCRRRPRNELLTSRSTRAVVPTSRLIASESRRMSTSGSASSVRRRVHVAGVEGRSSTLAMRATTGSTSSSEAASTAAWMAIANG